MSKQRAFVALSYVVIVLVSFIVLSFSGSTKALANNLLEVQVTSVIYLPIVSKNVTPTPPTPTPPTPTPPPVGDAIIIDHTSVALFDQIPDQYLTLARNTRMLFSDRSVGENINNFLNCFDSSTEWVDAPATCRKDYYDTTGSLWQSTTYPDPNYPTPARILFDPDPVKYNRDNWTFVYAQGDWEALTDGFVSQIVPQNLNTNDVLSYQFSYLNINFGSNIEDADDGFFVDLPHFGYYPNGRERWDISDIEGLETQYPSKTFIYWTTSLARSIGTPEGESFNNQMRQYAIANDKILFDVADIESHDPSGQPCYDNRDGVEYCNSANNCENHPNDGQNIAAICQDYTTELEGGHLGVSAGGLRIAKAFWVLMARLNGWTP